MVAFEKPAQPQAFFVELGMELEGETIVEGPSLDRLIGLQNAVRPSR